MSTGSKTFWLQSMRWNNSSAKFSSSTENMSNFFDMDTETYGRMGSNYLPNELLEFSYDCSTMPKSAIVNSVHITTKYTGHVSSKNTLSNIFCTKYIRKYNQSSEFSDCFKNSLTDYTRRITPNNYYTISPVPAYVTSSSIRTKTLSSEEATTDVNNIALNIKTNFSQGYLWRYGNTVKNWDGTSITRSGPVLLGDGLQSTDAYFYYSQLIVDYTLPDWTITASSNDSTMGTVNGSSSDTFTINEEGSYTLTASPNSGYYFSHWAKATSPSVPIEGANATWTLTGEKYYDDFGASGNFVAVFKALPKLTYSFSQYIGALSGGYINVYIVDGGTSTRIIDGATTAGEYTFSEAQLGKALQIRFIPASLRPEGTFLRSYTINGETTLNDTVGTVVKDISSISADITLITNFSRYPKVEITVAPEGTTGVVDGQSFKPTLTSYIMPSSSRTFTASDTDSFAESQVHGDHGGYFYQWLQGSTVVSENPALTVAVATSDLAYTLMYKPYLQILAGVQNCTITPESVDKVKQGVPVGFELIPSGDTYYADRAELFWLDPTEPSTPITETIVSTSYDSWTFYVTASDESDISMMAYGRLNPIIQLESELIEIQLLEDNNSEIVSSNILRVHPQISHIHQIAYKKDGTNYFIDIFEKDYSLISNDEETDYSLVQISENFLGIFNDDTISEIVLIGKPLNTEEEQSEGDVWFGTDEQRIEQSTAYTTDYRPNAQVRCNTAVRSGASSVTFKGWGYEGPEPAPEIPTSRSFMYTVPRPTSEETLYVVWHAMYKAWPQIDALPCLLLRNVDLSEGLLANFDYCWLGQGGSAEVQGGPYHEPGTDVTIIAEPDSQYDFYQWAELDEDDPELFILIEGATDSTYIFTLTDDKKERTFLPLFIEKGKLVSVRKNINNTQYQPTLYTLDGTVMQDFSGWEIVPDSQITIDPRASQTQYTTTSYLFEGVKVDEYEGEKFSPTNNIIYLGGSGHTTIPSCYYAEGIRLEEVTFPYEKSQPVHVEFYCVYLPETNALILHDTAEQQGLHYEYDHIIIYSDDPSVTTILGTYETDPIQFSVAEAHKGKYLGFRTHIEQKADMMGHFYDGEHRAESDCGWFSAIDQSDGAEYTVTQGEKNFYCKPGSSMTFSAHPAEEWVFSHWNVIDGNTGEEVVIESPTNPVITLNNVQYDWSTEYQPWEVYAHFLHTIQVTAIGFDIVDDREESTLGEFCTITGTGEKVIGSTVTLTCTPNNDYIFAYWVYGGQIYYDNPILTFTAPSQPVRAVAHVKQKRDCVYLGNQTLKQKGYDPVIAIYQGTTEIPIEYVHP